jgi:hypothetical protein
MRKVLVIGGTLLGMTFFALLLVSNLKPAAPQTFRSETLLELPVEDAWRLLKDLSLAHYYVPGVIRTEISTAASEGAGTSRRVYSSDTDYINETITEWRSGSGFTMELHRDDGTARMPFQQRLEAVSGSMKRFYENNHRLDKEASRF